MGPSISVTPKQPSQYGITPANLQFQKRYWKECLYFRIDKAVPIRMIYPNTQNRNLEEIRKTFTKWKIDSITNLVTISISKGIAEIERENLQMMRLTEG
jgi:hypothetical protein